MKFLELQGCFKGFQGVLGAFREISEYFLKGIRDVPGGSMCGPSGFKAFQRCSVGSEVVSEARNVQRSFKRFH